MSKTQKNVVIVLAIVFATTIVLLFAVKFYVIPLRERRFHSNRFFNMHREMPGDFRRGEENKERDDSNIGGVGIANPASQHCMKQGGTLKITSRPDGAQYGLCYFDDNRACEEWAMMRGDCPVGGVKTTGFDTDAQRFCAWSGGQTVAADKAMCTFKDGSKCLDDDYFTGNCQPGNNLK